ncbi:MAG: response regulator [Thermodesulfobacteriota bacterium]|nr:response regulator [Thermodesulfobacteriota bacterium]
MPVISIFSGTFCKEEPIISSIHKAAGKELVADKDVVAEASRLSGIAEAKIDKAFSAKTSVFNKFTHEREHSIAYLKLALAQILAGDELVIAGFVGQLIPRDVSHVLRVCLIADMKTRVSGAAESQDIAESEAIKIIHKQDEDRASWTHTLFNCNDPWDTSLYDIIIPTDKMGTEDVVALIIENSEKEAIKKTEQSTSAVEDFLLAANVEVALVKEGHNVGVGAKKGSVTLTIDKHVLMLSRLESELASIVENLPGVQSVETKVGPGFHRTDIYRKYDFEKPSKILLVDDEREFVQTLSERLLMREMGSAVTYDGESALELVKEDEPDVMILDLKMPGIDGIEVLRKIKETQPQIEVIILTGHGSETDRETCMNLGAFAYLHKPVDINELSNTIKKANEKIHQKKAK